MEAVIGLFLIVIVFAMFSGAGRTAEGERAAPRSDGPRAAAVTQEGGSSGILQVMILLLTIVALVMSAS